MQSVEHVHEKHILVGSISLYVVASLIYFHTGWKRVKKKDLSGIFWRSNLLCKITCTLDVQLATIYF